jgi:hypothetical protein
MGRGMPKILRGILFSFKAYFKIIRFRKFCKLPKFTSLSILHVLTVSLSLSRVFFPFLLYILFIYEDSIQTVLEK